nr:MAG TPA: hypothetical protein [Caudoviricetes sp.]
MCYQNIDFQPIQAFLNKFAMLAKRISNLCLFNREAAP